ncbi:Uncharacterized protein APZ42_021948 [Daphnia magna]|uniref:Cc8K15.2-like protein n=1 Tax=Daphnia magna TaxID=35525 RepID=A0A164W7L6_9CRUS|nr:Uncharacterized protein APZ42_021948 [Daphnia magna]
MCSEVFHEKLWKDFQKVKKLPADRTSEKSKAYINIFTVKLNQLCDLSPKAKAAQTQGSASAVLSDESEDDDESEVEFDLTSGDEFEPESSRSTPRPKSVTLEIPTKTLSKDTELSADATNLSIRSHTIICHRQRSESRLNKSDAIKSDFILEKVPMLTHVVIHWNSKMINSERVVGMISGQPMIEKPKLLGIPVVPRSTGVAQCQAFVGLLEEWQVLNIAIAIVFDTTSSNTGRLSGCAILIEKRLGKTLLWFACRHHVYEVHVKHVCDHINGSRNSPSDSLCVRFSKEWPNINHQEISDLQMIDKGEICDELRAIAESVGEWGNKLLEEDVFSREDYRELLELTSVYLGVVVYPFKFRKPGAHHHARFMAYAIYYLKMQLLSNSFEMSVDEVRGVKRMANFIALFYTEAFLKSRLASAAPSSDQKFLSLMKIYAREDKSAAELGKMTGYKTTEKIVRSLEVFNDCAERRIKLVSDFKDVCKDVKEQEVLFQVIENHHNHFTSATKKNLKGVV